MLDLIFNKSIQDVDPDVHEVTQLEAARQVRRIILIPSESVSPLAPIVIGT